MQRSWIEWVRTYLEVLPFPNGPDVESKCTDELPGDDAKQHPQKLGEHCRLGHDRRWIRPVNHDVDERGTVGCWLEDQEVASGE